MTKLEIRVDSMPCNLQSNYCIGKYSDHILACHFYDTPICLSKCHYAKKKTEERIIDSAGKSMECAG